MKRFSVFIVLAGLLFSPGCKSPASPSSDLAGTWKGNTGSGEAGKTFDLNLTVDSSGNVTGSGVSSTWSVGSSGKVTGGGTFSVVSWGTYKTLQATWNLQLNSAKNQLTGTLATSDAFIGTVIVTLNKS
jgi:hypothetical protein